MASERYVNRNPYPITLPDSRGGQVMFRPGEGTTVAWFSRMIGPRRLTRETTDGTPIISKPQRPAPKPPVPQVDEKPKPALTSLPREIATPQPLPSFPNTETEEYRVQSGIYRCKLCNVFATGSRVSMARHLSDYHGKHEMLQVPADIVPNLSTRPQAVAEAAPAKTPAESDVSAQGAAQAPTAPEKEAPEPLRRTVFRCQVSGCGKKFSTAAGLVAHMERVHPISKEMFPSEGQ